MLICNSVPETVPALSLSRLENVILIQDQEFELTCSTININYDFLLSWILPSEAVRSIAPKFIAWSEVNYIQHIVKPYLLKHFNYNLGSTGNP